MYSEDYLKKNEECIHNMHLSVLEYDVDFWLKEAYENIENHKKELTSKEHDDARVAAFAIAHVAKSHIKGWRDK